MENLDVKKAKKLIEDVNEKCAELKEMGLPLIFCVAGDGIGCSLYTSVEVLETPLFLCDVVKAIVMQKKESIEAIEKEAEEKTGIRSKIVSMKPMGEA